jgi:ketosteroid isomerase-like protein
MSLTETEKAGIRAAMQAYATAYRMNDIDGMEAVFSPDICGFGSGPDEVIRNHGDFIQQIRRDMSQATIHSVEFSDTNISGEGQVAWVMTMSSITFSVGDSPAQILQGRSTMVMRNTGTRWLIEQIHFSMPYGGQSAGQSFPGA